MSALALGIGKSICGHPRLLHDMGMDRKLKRPAPAVAGAGLSFRPRTVGRFRGRRHLAGIRSGCAPLIGQSRLEHLVVGVVDHGRGRKDGRTEAEDLLGSERGFLPATHEPQHVSGQPRFGQGPRPRERPSKAPPQGLVLRDIAFD